MSIRKTPEEFIRDAIAVHGDRYDYSLICYTNNKTKIEIICPKHGIFKQPPHDHINKKQGCNKCANNQLKTTKEFIQDAISVHGDRYDYSLVKYINTKTKVEIICKRHGIFLQQPYSHLVHKGCKKCATIISADKLRGNTEDFIKKARLFHGDIYDYSLVQYYNTHTKVKIKCPTHGIFEQEPSGHLIHGCNQCAIDMKPYICNSKSYMEQAWLTHIGLPDTDGHRRCTLMLNEQWIYPDGYNSDTNTIYEFYGDYWHGNPATHNPSHINSNNKKTFGELYQQTMDRETLIKSHGYHMITIWENDWIK